MKYESASLLQINELVEEINRETLDIPKILKLFKELFEDLVAVTTAWKCVEIDRFCTALCISGEISRMPVRLQEIVDDCTTLHDYPAEFCLAQPQEILRRINELCKGLNIDLQTIKTKKDRIIEMYEKGMDMERIARELETPQYLVKTILTRRKQDTRSPQTT